MRNRRGLFGINIVLLVIVFVVGLLVGVYAIAKLSSDDYDGQGFFATVGGFVFGLGEKRAEDVYFDDKPGSEGVGNEEDENVNDGTVGQSYGNEENGFDQLSALGTGASSASGESGGKIVDSSGNVYGSGVVEVDDGVGLVSGEGYGGADSDSSVVESDVELVESEGVIKARVSTGEERTIRVAPEQAIEAVQAREVNRIRVEERVGENVPEVVYNIEGEVPGRFLGVFGFSYERQYEVNAETGEIKTRSPWWAVFVNVDSDYESIPTAVPGSVAEREQTQDQEQNREEERVCAADVKECDDGSYVGRDPDSDCNFRPCEGFIPEDELVCTTNGGEWEQFSNSCAGSCEVRRNPEIVSCAQALTWGCECGDGMCWNSEAEECESVEVSA